jgi:hypothetical protein
MRKSSWSNSPGAAAPRLRFRFVLGGGGAGSLAGTILLLVPPLCHSRWASVAARCSVGGLETARIE